MQQLWRIPQPEAGEIIILAETKIYAIMYAKEAWQNADRVLRGFEPRWALCSQLGDRVYIASGLGRQWNAPQPDAA